MALVKSLKGVKLLIKVGDGATPTEAFSHPCLINTSRGISFASDLNQQDIPDCDDPDLLAWQTADKKSISATISGSGMLNTTDIDTFYGWVTGATTKNVTVETSGVTGANGGRKWVGAFHCTKFEITGDRGARCECSIELVSDGALTKSSLA